MGKSMMMRLSSRDAERAPSRDTERAFDEIQHGFHQNKTRRKACYML